MTQNSTSWQHSITVALPIYHESFMTTAATVSSNLATKQTNATKTTPRSMSAAQGNYVPLQSKQTQPTGQYFRPRTQSNISVNKAVYFQRYPSVVWATSSGQPRDPNCNDVIDRPVTHSWPNSITSNIIIIIITIITRVYSARYHRPFIAAAAAAAWLATWRHSMSSSDGPRIAMQSCAIPRSILPILQFIWILHQAVNNQEVIKMSDGHRNVVIR